MHNKNCCKFYVLQILNFYVTYLPIQYLTILISISVKSFGQQIGYKKHIKRVNKE